MSLKTQQPLFAFQTKLHLDTILLNLLGDLYKKRVPEHSNPELVLDKLVLLNYCFPQKFLMFLQFLL